MHWPTLTPPDVASPSLPTPALAFKQVVPRPALAPFTCAVILAKWLLALAAEPT